MPLQKCLQESHQGGARCTSPIFAGQGWPGGSQGACPADPTSRALHPMSASSAGPCVPLPRLLSYLLWTIKLTRFRQGQRFPGPAKKNVTRGMAQWGLGKSAPVPVDVGRDPGCAHRRGEDERMGLGTPAAQVFSARLLPDSEAAVLR